MSSKFLLSFAAAAVAAFVVSAPVSAETITYTAALKGSAEVPPNASAGTGTATAVLDTATKKLTYTVDYSGLSGPGTAAHFHGPAEATANAPPVIPVSGGVASPIKGEATLTDAQVTAFAEGKMYFNVHTEANKGGEIRGQMAKK